MSLTVGASLDQLCMRVPLCTYCESSCVLLRLCILDAAVASVSNDVRGGRKEVSWQWVSCCFSRIFPEGVYYVFFYIYTYTRLAYAYNVIKIRRTNCGLASVLYAQHAISETVSVCVFCNF